MIKFVILLVKRTSFVRAGGRRIRFAVYSLIKDNIFYGLGKGIEYDFVCAINKSLAIAKYNLNLIGIKLGTIFKPMCYSIGKTTTKFYPVYANSGILAGGIIRKILSFFGVLNIVCILIGSRNKVNVLKATYNSFIYNESR